MRPLLSLTMAFEHVRAGMGRMLLSVLAVALGVALVVAFRMMNAAVLTSFLDTVDAMAGRTALTVTAGNGLTFPEDVAQAVARVPGVDLAVPLVRSVAFPTDGSGELLTVLGVETTNEAAIRVYRGAGDRDVVLDDPLSFLMEADSILVGREFAEGRGLEVGGSIDLVTPRGRRRFTVRGLLESEGMVRLLAGRLVVMDLFAAEDAFTGARQISQVDVVLAEGVAVETAKAAVAAAVGPGLSVEEPAFQKRLARRTVSGFRAMMTGSSLLAVLAGFVICYSRLGAIFGARTWEVGLLRAVGLRRSTVFTELLKESLLLGSLGAAVGIPLGIMIGKWGLPLFAKGAALLFELPIAAATPEVTVSVVGVGVAVGLLAAALATIVPALRLSRTNPVAALTRKGRRLPESKRRLGRKIGLVLLAAVCGLVPWQLLSGMTVLGNLTTLIVALLTVLLARPLVSRGSALLVKFSRRVLGPIGELAAGHLAEDPRRAGLTIATLGVGIGGVFVFGVIGWSFQGTLASQLRSRLRADLFVNSAFNSGGYRPAPLSEELIGKLKEIPGVLIASGEQRREISYAAGTVTISSYDRPCLRDHRVCNWPLESGALPAALEIVARGEGVVVSSSFARAFETQPGDTIYLSSPHGQQAFRVVGVTDAATVTAVIMNRARYRQSWNDSLLSWVQVVVAKDARPEDVQARIERSLGEEYVLEVRSAAAMIEYSVGLLRRGFGVFYLIQAISLLLVLVAIGDALATGVVEHSREFGMFRAVGLRRSQLSGIVMFEGAAIGALGLLLAIGTGLALGVFWVKVQLPAIVGCYVELHLPAGFVFGAAVVTMALCLVGSVVPSFHAARVSVPRALRDE